MLDQHPRRWADVVQILYKCFVFAGNSSWSGITYCWQRLQADTYPMSSKCRASFSNTGQYSFSSSQYFTLPHDALNQNWVNVGQPSVTLVHIQRDTKHDTVTQYWANVGTASWTVSQH